MRATTRTFGIRYDIGVWVVRRAACAGPPPPPRPPAPNHRHPLQLRALGYSEDLIEILFKTGGVGNPPDMKQLWEAMAPAPDIWNTGGGAHAPGGQFAYASPDELQLMYKFLKSPGPFPDEVDPTIREQYMEDEEFEEVMGMSKEAFNETPKWKQQKLKEAAQLF